MGSSIHINLQIILEVHKKGGVEHDSWSGLLGGRDPCTHREALRGSRMLTTQGNLNREDKTQIHAFQPESQECILLTTWWPFCCLWRQVSPTFYYRGRSHLNSSEWLCQTLPSLDHYSSLGEMSPVLYGLLTSTALPWTSMLLVSWVSLENLQALASSLNFLLPPENPSSWYFSMAFCLIPFQLPLLSFLRLHWDTAVSICICFTYDFFQVRVAMFSLCNEDLLPGSNLLIIWPFT